MDPLFGPSGGLGTGNVAAVVPRFRARGRLEEIRRSSS